MSCSPLELPRCVMPECAQAILNFATRFIVLYVRCVLGLVLLAMYTWVCWIVALMANATVLRHTVLEDGAYVIYTTVAIMILVPVMIWLGTIPDAFRRRARE